MIDLGVADFVLLDFERTLRAKMRCGCKVEMLWQIDATQAPDDDIPDVCATWCREPEHRRLDRVRMRG